jgi:adenylate cyclase
MTRRVSRTVIRAGVLPVLIAGILCLVRLNLFHPLELTAYDALARTAPARPPSGQVVIVDVDERSLATFGQWPWRRDLMGRLISTIRDMGASVTALDIMFAEPDRGRTAEFDPDAALADVVRGGRVVLGYGLTFDGPPTGSVLCGHRPFGVSVIEPPGVHVDQPFFDVTTAICNLPVLTSAAEASGFLNAAPDSDGILRRVPLLARSGDRVYPSLALAAVTAATGAREPVVRVSNANAISLSVGDLDVPLDGKSHMLLRLRGGKRTFPYISAADLLEQTAPPDAIRDKIVFVGTTALGTREVVATPLDTLFVGVEVQATVADNLLQLDPYRRPVHAVSLETALTLALGLLVVFAVWRYGVFRGGSAAAIAMPLPWGAGAWLLSNEGIFLSPLYPTLGMITSLAGMVVAGFTAERARADQAGADNLTSRRLMVQTLLSLTGIRDAETGRHSRRTQQVTRVLATQLAAHPAYRDHLTPERVELIASLAPLHDIGKVGVPDRILNKPGLLTPEERSEMQQHPRYGRDVIDEAERVVGVRDDLTLSIAKDIVYTHHEKWDGSGYPQGLKGHEIPVPGRIMALVDVYDAVHTRQLYGAPLSHQETVDLVRRGSGTHFDPVVVEAFVVVAETLRSMPDDHERTSDGAANPAAVAANA